MNYRSFLIKYAEIGVKGKNRYLFEDALVKQIHHRLKRLEGGFTVTKEAGVFTPRPVKPMILTRW